MLCGICPVPPKNEIRKTALGTTESVDWEYFNDSTDCIKGLTEKGYKIISIEQADNATDLNNYSIKKSQKIALVFGNEVNGVSEEISSMCHGKVTIPKIGEAESLNVGVATGIVCDNLFRSLYD